MRENRLILINIGIILLISFVSLYVGLYYLAYNNAKKEIEAKYFYNMLTLQSELKQIKSSREYQAIQKCQSENYWKAECIAWEMNERK